MDDETTADITDPDAELMLKLKDGDRSAFDQIVLRWQNPLINFFYRSLHSYERSEDLSQMVFIRIYKAAPKYEPRARFSTYLFQIARHHLINEYRSQGRRPMDLKDPFELYAETNDDSERAVNELEEAFEQAMVTELLLFEQ